MLKKLKITVICGGPSGEHEVSLATAEMVMLHLDPSKYIAEKIIVKKDGSWQFKNGAPLGIERALLKLNKTRPDLVFNVMHGAVGEDGRLQALLEMLRLNYTGSGVFSSALAMNKNFANEIYVNNGFNVPEFAVIGMGNKNQKLPVTFPLVAKPVSGGSSVGVRIINSAKELKALLAKRKSADEIMLQQYVKGREFTCGVLEAKNGQPFALPVTEIIPNDSQFFDYKAKYKIGGSTEITPAQLAANKTAELQALAIKAHCALGCRGMSRSDFILSEQGKLYILETNTIPGMTKTSLLPQAAQVAGITFEKMLDLIIAAGMRAHRSVSS